MKIKYLLLLLVPFITNTEEPNLKTPSNYKFSGDQQTGKTIFIGLNEFMLDDPNEGIDPKNLSGDSLITYQANQLIKEGKLDEAAALLETTAIARYIKVQQLKEEADKTDDPKKACELLTEAWLIVQQLLSEQSKK